MQIYTASSLSQPEKDAQPPMTQSIQPGLPLPPSLRGAEIGSFAHYTILVRMPKIARRVLAENSLSPEAIDKLESLISELPSGKIRQLTDVGAPDATGWQEMVAPYLHQDWLEVPWFFAETYFYRRIVEATGFFEVGHGQGSDPYRVQKQLGLENARIAIRDLSSQLGSWLAQPWNEVIFSRLLSVDLWGNQVDLSIWPAGEDGQPSHASSDQQLAHLLADDSEQVFRHLDSSPGPVQVEFIVDNAGFELVGDLCLADYLLSSKRASTVRLNLKSHPTFVSDAMIVDVEKSVAFLEADHHQDIRAFGARLRAHLQSGRLLLADHLFWTSSWDAWQMPQQLRDELSPSRLIISKGDANYRRLLGDRHWPFTTPFADIVSYFPAPLVALRTMKSPIATGLRAERVQELDQNSSDWVQSGQYGVIQFAMGK